MSKKIFWKGEAFAALRKRKQTFHFVHKLLIIFSEKENIIIVWFNPIAGDNFLRVKSKDRKR